jgi:hypothetical protein
MRHRISQERAAQKTADLTLLLSLLLSLPPARRPECLPVSAVSAALFKREPRSNACSAHP